MALEIYRKKRNFGATTEPRGKRARKGGNAFVIHKHAARRLHYDLRLEMDGVLKSWAVTRGPSLVAGEKRLAVHVEDHPVDYGSFEGTIPKGEYGAGAVLVWDRGTWEPVGDPHKGYDKGHLEFSLAGEKLAGLWHLVRMDGAKDTSRDNWLLIKADDAAALSSDAPDVLEQAPLSVATGRTIEDIVGGKTIGKTRPRGSNRATSKGPAKSPDAQKRDTRMPKGARAAAMPGFVEPTLATLVARVPTGKGWIHEIKLDGYRLQAHVNRGRVSLITRSGLDWTEKFGTAIAGELAQLPCAEIVIDGEVVVEGGSGATDFSLLQRDLSEGRYDRFRFYAFDLLHLDGHDLTGCRLGDRKKTLETLLPAATGPLVYCAHFDDGGDVVLKHACRLSLEGLVSKRVSAPYRHGRSRDWVKSKCSSRQELVIGGYMPSSVSDRMVGSLVMGIYEQGKLRHAGRVGTGFTASVAGDLYRILHEDRIKKSPFADRLSAEEARDVVYVSPAHVAEIEFRGWTGDRHLRHASFRGLREDKKAEDVVMEDTETTVAAAPRRSVALTHPDRVYWPEAGVTKGGLADYYTEVWRLMAPHVVGRPLALLRGPEGISGQMFFQKHAWRGISKHVALVDDPATAGAERYISIADLDGLLGLVQGGVLEIHPWGASLNDWEKPDTVIMDLDPGPDVSWQAVIDAALAVRERLQALGLAAFVKTSGGKGLHVVSPLTPRAEWPAVKAAMKAVAGAMAADEPDRYVATVTKSKRQGRILVDYLRNGRGATAVAPYSTRARPGAAVSMPIDWEELDSSIGPAYFTVDNAPTRVAGLKSDPWEDFRAAAVPLEVGAGRGRARR